MTVPKIKDSQILHVGDLDVKVTPKRMKNMYLRVVSPDASVQVTCPIGTKLQDIESFVKSRYAWIKEKQAQTLSSPASMAASASKQEIAKWRDLISKECPKLIEKWEPIIGVKVNTLTYRNMKTRWGTCQPKTAKVCINTRLALYPRECLEYVVVHELCHLHVSGHGPEFKALMDRFLPNWRQIRAMLK